MQDLREEKKVEYLELIYDLIFVYIIGRNNALLHHVENGFVSGATFWAYTLYSLALIQIWNYSTFYINRFGRNKLRDHIFIFFNMYLLYYIGEGTQLEWESFQNQYHAAWALILLNLGIQHAIEMRNHRGDFETCRSIRRVMIVLFGQALIVLAAIPVYNLTGLSLAPIAIGWGIATSWFASGSRAASLTDFPHLSERAMLYVVFTFGEMIITLASYFEGAFTPRALYFSTMSFLLVVGLFLCYELLYNRIVDREARTTGMLYMLIHVFLIFSMNTITASLEFMRDTDVALWPKILFLTGSILLYFLCLFALQGFARSGRKLCRRFLIPILTLTAAFVALMLLLRENMVLNILISVLYVFAVGLNICRFSRRGA